MASQQGRDNQQSDHYLSQNQQDLLLAALNSQATGREQTYAQSDIAGVVKRSSSESSNRQATMNGSSSDVGLFMSPQQAELDHFNGDFTPDLDYLDADDFDFENADLGGEMIGTLPGDLSNGAEHHEKRKSPDENDDEEEGDTKRQETQEGEKGAKKPGRKPLTSEPTTKRKAQNRAAQRAFRERKEKHLKDLETKVQELTKSHEADRHENGLLKAQIERLGVELREYRKRLSLNGGSGANRSPPLAASGSQNRSIYPAAYGNSFQFDFPKFGALPGSQIFGQGLSNGSSTSSGQRDSVTPPVANSPTHRSFSGQPLPKQASSENSMARTSMSPRSLSLSGNNGGSPSQMTNLNPSFSNAPYTSYSTNDNMHGFASTLPQMSNAASDPFGGLFSPSILKSASVDSTNAYFNDPTQINGTTNLSSLNEFIGGDSTAGPNGVLQFTGSSSGVSDSASPSGSSATPWNGNTNSSCGTSPEPSHESPANKPMNTMRNQSALVTNQTNVGAGQLINGDYSIPSVDTFDPQLFGDYRDSQDAIVGGGDFTGGFFDEALNPSHFDYPSPSNLFGILQSPSQPNALLHVNSNVANAPTPSQNLMAEIDKTRDGGDEDYGLPSMKQKKADDLKDNMISCNNIWNQLQSNPDFQEGKFDLDSLCSELRNKARCSESGVMVDQEHVDAALKRLGKKDDQGKPYEGSTHLMFEQESWDNVLKKLGQAS